MRFYLLIFFIGLSTIASFARQPGVLIPGDNYPPEGVYFSFSAFRNGKPDLLKSQLIKSINGTDFTIRQWASTENLYYSDANGAKQSLEISSIWGFSENANLYVFVGNKFHKILVLGQISYFLESYPMIKGNMSPVVTETQATSSYRFFDMETGDIYDYNVENLEELLVRDENLSTEFKTIKSQKLKRKKMYSFMERFNKEHPLRVQENQ